MRRVLVRCAFLCLAAFPSCGGSSKEAGTPEQAENRAALEAVQTWLAALDSANYDVTWSQAATVFRTSNGSPGNWASAAGEMRGPLGAVVSRRLKESAPSHLQDGASYAFAFETNFEAHPTATEEVTVVLESGFWKVAGYLVR